MKDENETTETKPTKAVANQVDALVMCDAADAFEFFGASLVNIYECYFPGGEDQIRKISADFFDVYKRNLERNNDDIVFGNLISSRTGETLTVSRKGN